MVVLKSPSEERNGISGDSLLIKMSTRSAFRVRWMLIIFDDNDCRKSQQIIVFLIRDEGYPLNPDSAIR